MAGGRVRSGEGVCHERARARNPSDTDRPVPAAGRLRWPVTVSDLAVSAGLEVIETGGLASARYLEPLAGLNIALAYGLGHGTDIAPTWQRAA